jgi:hypothetical protein
MHFQSGDIHDPFQFRTLEAFKGFHFLNSPSLPRWGLILSEGLSPPKFQ